MTFRYLIYSCLLFLLSLGGSLFGEHTASGQQAAYEPVYLYLGAGTDWNQQSAAWDAKRVPLADRARIVRQQLPQQRQAEWQQLLPTLQSLPGIRAGSIERYWIAPVVRVEATPAAQAALLLHPAVASLMPVPTVTVDDAEASPQLVPPVPNGHESGHDAMGAPALWSLGYSGYGRKVYIIDSGVDPSHPAIGDRFWGNYVDPTHAWFEPGGTATPKGCGAHGTFVAGVILGRHPVTFDTTGVAPQAVWMASPPAASSGFGCASVDVIAALQFALDPDGDSTTVADLPDVINNSWSVNLGGAGAECTGPYADALSALEAAGIAVVFSAGNNGPGVQTISAPKNINLNPVNSFAVGSINGNNSSYSLAGSSSRGPSTCAGPQDTIKPEVVAPGVSVRTTGFNGSYVSVSGTSFAAPQAAGAVLLLKEAFPAASGKQVLEALYYSATDLGAPGPDNDYGNGIISLPQAFAYLVNQGFSPAAVRDSGDLGLVQVDLGPEADCDSIVLPVLTINNAGQDSIFSAEVIIQRQGRIDTLSWAGQLAPGETVDWTLPLDTAAVGMYDWLASVWRVNGQADPRFLNNRLAGSRSRLPQQAPVVAVPLVCPGTEVRLIAAIDQVAWYAQAQDLAPQALGRSWIIGPLNQDSIVFVAQTELAVGGKFNISNDTGDFQTADAGIRFDVEVPVELVSVQVFSQKDGFRRWQLLNGQGSVIIDTTIFVKLGGHRIALGFQIPVGKDYLLRLNSPNPQLFVSRSSVQYPYAIGSAATLTGSSEGSSAYPYFFGWEMRYEGCRSPVTVSVGQVPVSLDYAPRDTTVFLGDQMTWTQQSQGIIAWRWELDSLATGQGPAFSWTADSLGIFPLRLTGTGTDGCRGLVRSDVQVVPPHTSLEAAQDRYWRLYPNPARSAVTLEFSQPLTADAQVVLVGMDGRLAAEWRISLGQSREELVLPSLPAGTYLLRWQQGQRRGQQVLQVQP